MTKYQWLKTVVATASMFVFSVTLASADSITTAPANSNPYTYADPAATESSPSYSSVGQAVQENSNSLTLTNEQLGLSGPISVSGGYSANYGYELQASFAHMIGFYDAVSLLGAYAPQENRIDITWAHAWSEKNRTKLSVERLAEAMDFDYDSGTTTQWVPQYSFGAGYQYLFNKNWLRNVEVSSYYAQAQSQDLSTVRFESNGEMYDNYRHIAGATSKGSEATLNISPWKTGLIGLGLNYDSVKYNTKYEDTNAENAKGFGFTLSLEELLSKHVKLNLEGSQREVYDDYVAGVSFLTPSNLEVGIHGERTLGENGSSSDSRVTMNLAYFLDDKNRYESGYSLEDIGENDLAAWASKSPAFMDEVLATADQKTVKVVNSAPVPSQDATPSTDNAPVITLTAGEINNVNIADYIANSSLSDAQKQAAPAIAGGPENVEFIYDNATKALITKTEVPATAVGQEASPLVLVFPTTTNTNVAVTKNSIQSAVASKLTFQVTVTNSTIPYLNPGFEQNLTAVTNRVTSPWVFKYENVSDPAASPQDSTTMFINPYASSKYLTIPSLTNTNYFQKTGDVNNCYTAVADNSQNVETLTISSAASSVCPDNVSYKVKVCNTFSCSSSFQTINITASAATSPYISGGAITDPVMVSDQAYSPGHTFTTEEVSPGEGATFNTDSSQTYLKVYDATTGCVDVTSSSNLGLGFTAGNTQAILQSSSAIPASLSGHNLKIYLHVTNLTSDASSGSSADNGTTSNCGGTPFTTTVEGAPIVPGNLDMGTGTVDTAYNYDFTAHGVTSGSSEFTSGTATTKIVNNDGSETEVDNAALGLTFNVAATSVTMTGIPTVTYAGDIVHVYLNLTNAQGYSASNTAADILTLAANPTETPVVGSGAIASAKVTETYPGAALTGTTSGTNRTYANVNTVSDSGTYVKVANSAGTDVTSQVHVNLASSGQVLSLQSDGAVIDSALPSGTYNVYVHVINDANSASSNCSDVTCSVLTGGTPYTMVVNTPSTLTGGVTLTAGSVGTAYNYDFVSAGTLVVGSSALVPDTSTVTIKVVNTDNSETTVTDSGVAYTVTADDVVLSGVPTAAYGGKTLHVYLNLTDAAGFVTTNTVAENLSIEVPSTQVPTVGGGMAVTSANVTQSYAGYTFTNVSPGDGRSYADMNTQTGTHVQVVNSAGTDVTSQAHVNLANTGATLLLQSDGSSVDSSLPSGSYNVFVTVVNDANARATNTTPYTMVVNTPSTLAGGVTLPIGAVGAAYNYDFVSTGTLVLGSSDLVPASSGVTIKVVNTDNSETTVTDSGIISTITTSNVVLSGTPTLTYGGKTLHVYLNLVDAAGFVTANTVAENLSIEVPITPTVGGGMAVTSANATQNYAGYTFTNVSPGDGASYADMNAASGTHVQVVNSSGTDVTSLAHVNLANTSDTLLLQSDGTPVDSSLPSGTYNVFVTVVNNLGATATNASPYTMVVNTPPAIVANAALDNATIATPYSYDFAAKGTITVGSTDLTTSTLTMTNSAGVAVNPSDLGLTATYSATDIVLAGTPVAATAGTYKVFVTMQDEAGFTVNNTAAPATLTIVATAPSVISGALPAATLNGPYSYMFANSGTTGPVVSAGAGEYFDEAGTSFTVTGSVSGPMTSQFHLVYSNDGTVSNSNAVTNNHNNVVTLASNGNLTQSETLTVTFHVVNVDSGNVDGSPGTVTVGSVPAYMYCPLGDSSAVASRAQTATSNSYDNAAMTGTLLETVTFNRQSYIGSGNLQLSSASIANNQLTCNYIVTGEPDMPSYVATSTTLNGLQATGSGWNGSSCSVPSLYNPTTAATSCQVTYTYTGS